MEEDRVEVRGEKSTQEKKGRGRSGGEKEEVKKGRAKEGRR